MLKFECYTILLVLAGCHGLCPQVFKQNFHIKDVTDVTELVKQVDCIRPGVVIRNLIITNLNVKFLPRGLFNDTNIKTLIIKHSSVDSLAPRDNGTISAFNGLEDHLERFTVVKPNKGTFNWDWRELSGMRNLAKISIGREALAEITLDKTFLEMNLKNLKWIQLTGVCMSKLNNYVFSGFPNLEKVSLQGNRLKRITRNYFPNPANNLTHVDLSFNELTDIEKLLFSNMPVIEEINLSNNNIKSFSALDHVLPNLRKIYLFDNPLNCNGTIKWLAKLDKVDSEGTPFFEDRDRLLLCKIEGTEDVTEVNKLKSKDLRNEKQAPKPKMVAQNYLPIKKCYLKSTYMPNVSSVWYSSQVMF